MKVVCTRDGATRRLRFEGADVLDVAAVQRLRSRVTQEIDGDCDVEVDLSEVEFIDSAGVGLLVRLYKSAHARGRGCRFHGARPGVARVLRILQLDRIFDLEPAPG